MDSLLENLNEKQREAVETTQGPLLVLSGAGTGKTSVLTTRIAYILNRNLCMPWNVLALTFTNKAANEMKSRLATLSVGTWYPDGIWCGTFHSICLRILRANAEHIGLLRNFIVYDEDDQKSVIKSLITSSTKQPADYVEEFSRIKDRGLIAYQSKDKLFNAYNAELARLNAVDFGDIILRVLKMFNEHPDILARYQNQFKYILVDEFQDTNSAQMELLCMLTSGVEKPNICCVGDDDQSIYSWRGAEIKHILNFEKNFPGTKVIRLETNYRSTSNILGAANSLIRHNRGRLGKDLHPYNKIGMGEPVYVLTLPTDRDEAQLIADTILRTDLTNFTQFAVLARSDKYWLSIEKEFISRGIPYKILGNRKLYDRSEIKDVLAFVRLLVTHSDDIAFKRIIGKPSRQIGPKAIEKIKQSGPNLMTGLRDASLSAKQRAAADQFLSAFDFDWESVEPKVAVRHVLSNAGYYDWLKTQTDTDVKDRIDRIEFLIEKEIGEYPTLYSFLDYASLMSVSDDELDGNFVSLMTLHAAKGLEFDTVFLPAWEEDVFPNKKSMESGDVEEERRLAYVAITRAKRVCIISNTNTRWMYGEVKYNSPSRFITEIDNRYLDFQGGAPRARTYYATPQRPTYDAPPKPRPTPVQNNTLKGKFVTHSEMGSGVVIEDNGNILTVAFKNRGIKKVARQFVTVS